ncbi:hypothetical protein [Gordonia sp. SL306]|uniref:hypothetical protein n=1 Tax=Gordonia sp. SL306 TaxID=2995145 RepID=UPI0022711BDD|nr:hypothetical protein [Gordonia sp. SL306]WAC54176.1 hypothetical protein OVA31_15950 [Gordonia sp. SL306]
MTLLTQDHPDPSAVEAREVARERASSRRNHLRYRLTVMATTPSEVVEFCGGWLFDHAMAGWDVSVHILDRGASTVPLEILGTRVLDLRPSHALCTWTQWPQSLAISADLCHADERFQRAAAAALRARRADVRLWGSQYPEALEVGSAPDEHRVSNAALAFKRRALRAAGLPGDPVAAVEYFRFTQALPE